MIVVLTYVMLWYGVNFSDHLVIFYAKAVEPSDLLKIFISFLVMSDNSTIYKLHPPWDL